MLRFVLPCMLALTALAIPPVSDFAAAEPISPQSVGLSVQKAFLCVTLTITAPGDMHTWVSIDWGDGVVEEWWELSCVGGCSGSFSHTYVTAGTWTITGWEAHLPPGTGKSISVDVVDSPEFTLSSYAQGENWIQLATLDSVYTAKSPVSTIDWGDGSEVEEFRWDNCEGGGFCTPVHVYPAAGEYPVVARIEYLDFRSSTCYERTASYQAVIGQPSPVQTSTWGAIKALFDG